ncbi:T9SS type A sorting domain-containing protein [Xanthocytophaga flava]|uniref:T9SS type A sorting domain-containing protein n=1 Tax=Xanthocytophaga flava TaxID=3048013 RepID=UPI0028D665AC|nr:T9SS type A sorting domain-containing protein [Xanthocytophaga flavus]MDJ1469514.1 T9SS type A sorting domain-containing protein [Xanthocytophaga flavus]
MSLGTVAGSWAGTNLIANGTIAGTLSAGLTLNNVTFNGTQTLNGRYTFTGPTTMNGGSLLFGGSGNNVFSGVTVNAGNVSFANTGNNSFASVSLNGAINDVTWKFNPSGSGTNTITGAFTSTPGCGDIIVGSSTSGSQARVVLSSAQTLSGTTIQDIQNSTSNLTASNGVNNGNNTGITFSFGASPARTLYWVGGSGNWSETAHWSSSSGGPGGQCIPTINDDVNFNGSSFSAGSSTVTIDIDAVCRSMNWTGATNTPTLAGTAARTLTIAGNLTMIGAMNQTGAGSTFLGKVVFVATSTGRTINSGGKTFANVDFNGQGGGWALNTNNFIVVNTLNLVAGVLDATSRSITTGTLTVNNASDLTRSLNLGSSTGHIISGTGTVLDLQGNTSNFTLNPGTSTITLSGNGSIVVETGSQSKTLPNLTITNPTDITINTSNTANRITFGTINLSSSIAHNFTVNGSAPKTYGNFTINGNNNVVAFNGSNSASPNDNIFSAVTFTAGRTGTVATFNGTNTFNGAVNLNTGAGRANDIEFTGTNVFASTFTANLANTTGTELQFASGSGTTSFTGAVSLNPSNNANVDVVFNNATDFTSTLTIGNTSNTTFQGTGDNTFADVIVNPSSTFTLNNNGNSSFASATINSQSGSGVTWMFKSGMMATFSGNMDPRALCSASVTVKSTVAGSRANVNFPSVQYFNNYVLVQDIDASSGAMVNAYANPAPASPNNVNVLYNDGIVGYRTLYWVGGTSSWNSPLSWSTHSGGAGGACIPTASDDVVFDINSFSGPNQIASVTPAAAPWATCRNMTWTPDVDPMTPVLSFGNNQLEINGDLTLATGMTMSSSGTNALVHFTTNGATNAVPTRTITIPSGTVAKLPYALFNSVGVTWTLSDSGPFTVANELGLQAGTLNTNDISVSCGRLNANKSNGTFADRVLDIQNSEIHITGSSANGLSTGLDFRGDKFTFVTPGASSLLVFDDVPGWVEAFLGDNTTWGLNPGSPRSASMLRTMPNIRLENTDVDIHTADYNVSNSIANRITFRNVTNVNGGQFFIDGTCPHTYGTILVASGLSVNSADQRRIVGSSQPAPNNNIFTSTVTFGSDCGFRFEGDNVFQQNFTVAQTSDANNAFVFTETNVFNGVVDITGLNVNRVTPTVVFGANNLPTTFNRNVNFHGASVIYRVSGSATLAATRTMTFDNESIGWFVGGNGTNIAGEAIPGTGAYTFAGNLVLKTQAKTTFYNSSANTYSNITINDYCVFEFTSLATSTTTGLFTATGTCNTWRSINASIPGDLADITFNSNQTWSYVLARDLNVTGPKTVTANNSTNVGNSCTLTYMSFNSVPADGTFVWVGGNSQNTSTDSKWSNPKNWAVVPNPTNPNDPLPAIPVSSIINGSSCIPGSINNVVFNNDSFSNKGYSGGKYFDRVIVDIPVATCANMSWETNIRQDVILTTDATTNEIWVHGSLKLDPKMNNLFTGLFSFRYPITRGNVEQTIDADGTGGGQIEEFKGPIEINSVKATYKLTSPIIVNAADLGGVRRGNITLLNGDLKANGNDINLSGNWIIAPSTAPNPQSMFYHNNGNTVTFDGQNAVGGAQNIVAATSPFWNLVIGRESKPDPTDINNGSISNSFRWVVVQNQRGNSNDPGTNNNRNQPYDSGIKVDNNLTVAQGGLFDNGYQIVGNITGNLNVYDSGVLSIGNATVWSDYSNEAPLTSLFPTNFTTAHIALTTGSTVSYSSHGHQDISVTPSAYGNLYLRNANGTGGLMSGSQRKRMALGPIKINGDLTIEQGINLVDNGFQITGTATGKLTMGSNAILTLGSAAMDVATTTGTGYNPNANKSGKTTVGNTATQFPLNFTNANLNLDANSYVIYNAAANQFVKGLSSATASQQYGNLIIQNPTVSSPVMVHKTLTAATTVRGTLTINPNSNLIDNGFQITGTSGKTFRMSASDAIQDLTVQNATTGVTVSGTSQLVLGNATVPTTFPANYVNADINFDAGTTIVYFAGVGQTVKGLSSGTASQQYGNLVLTNPVISLPKVVSKTLDAKATIRGKLIINPNNNLIDNAFQIAGVGGVGNFTMQNATLAKNPLTGDALTNVATTGTSGESRITLGNATSTTATTFPTGYTLTSNHVNFELGTTVVYNAAVAQQIAGLQNNANPASTYANLILTNPASVPPAATVVWPVVKTVQSRSITVRGNLTINPNNTLADGGFQIMGTSGSKFSMFNTTLAQTVIPETGVTTGITGESRFVISSTGTTSTTFPGVTSPSLTGFRTGDGTGTYPSDINFESGTTVVYNSTNAQLVQGLGGTGNTTYANLVLTNGSNTGVSLVSKTLQSNGTASPGTRVRGSLTVNPNNNFIDNGLQISGIAGQTFTMNNATKSVNYVRAVTSNSTVIGATGESRLTLGTAATATTFPTGFLTLNDNDINFELGTTVVYNAGVAQQVQGIFNSTQASTANYANISFVNPAASGSVTKTFTNNARVRENLTIGGANAISASGVTNLVDMSGSNYKIYLGGNWYHHPANNFNARAGEVELEGTSTQTITTRSAQNYASEAGTQDFYNLTVNNTTVIPGIAVMLGSNVGVSRQMKFLQGLVRSNDLSNNVGKLDQSPSSQLLIIRDNASVINTSDISFVIGAVRKVGRISSGTFYFPIGYVAGTNSYYRPSGISSGTPLNSLASFISQFYYKNPNSEGFNPVAVELGDPNGSIRNASAKEFWMINRENLTDKVYVTLTWRNPESGGVGTNGDPNNYLGLRVAHWNTTISKWQNMGATGFTNHPTLSTVSDTSGALTSVYNTVHAAGPVESFSPFTLATQIDYNPLPVTLLDFTGKAVEQQVNLNWQTASELNTSYFVVEKSQNGKTFEEVTQVTATGNSSGLQTYQSIDYKPYTGVSYYRLKMVDQDGSYTYSKVIKVNFGVSGALGEITLFPNPGNGDVIYFTVNNTDVKIASIHDMLGRMIGYQTSWNAEGTLKVTFSERLAAGTYVAILVAKDGSSSTRFKFVVQ